MKSWWRINGILWKQYIIKHKVWLALLLVLGIGFRLGESGAGEAEEAGMAVGVCIGDEKGRELWDRLQQEEGIFRFRLLDSEAQLRRQVENGLLECGYVFPKGFYEELAAGKFRRQVTLYYSPASSAQRISYEVVFADLYRMLSEKILEDYLAQSGLKQQELTELLALKDAYEEDGSTFSFRYETVGGGEQEQERSLDLLRGCIGVLMLFMSLIGLGNCQDLSGVGISHPGKGGERIKSLSLHIAAAGSIVTGGVLVLLSGKAGDVRRELLGLLVFWVVLELYLRLLARMLPTSGAVYGMIPVLMLGSLLFSPVFIRIESFLPAAGLVGRLFPVTWYLEIFY